MAVHHWPLGLAPTSPSSCCCIHRGMGGWGGGWGWRWPCPYTRAVLQGDPHPCTLARRPSPHTQCTRVTHTLYHPAPTHLCNNRWEGDRDGCHDKLALLRHKLALPATPTSDTQQHAMPTKQTGVDGDSTPPHKRELPARPGYYTATRCAVCRCSHDSEEGPHDGYTATCCAVCRGTHGSEEGPHDGTPPRVVRCAGALMAVKRGHMTGTPPRVVQCAGALMAVKRGHMTGTPPRVVQCAGALWQ